MEGGASFDPESASMHVKEMAPGPLRDGAIRGLANRIALGKSSLVPDFEGAWHWAQSMSSPETRGKLVSEIERAWRERDTESATEFLENER